MSREDPRGTFVRLGGLAAIGFAVTIVLPNLVAVPAGLPSTGADPDQVGHFFGTRATILGLVSGLGPVAWLLATVFGAAAVAALRPAERRRDEAWSLVGLAGLVLQNATFAGVTAIRTALGEVADRGESAVAPLWALHEALFTLNGTFLAVALLGLSVAGTRTGLLARPLAVLGYVSAGLLFLSACLAFTVVDGGLGLLGLSGWLLWVVWLVGYGVTLIRSGSGRRGAPAYAPGR